MSIPAALLLALISVLFGYRWGWVRAHVVIAKECKQLGGFYVAGETFKCSLIEPEEKK
jgi:hypothetical protein